MSSPSDKVGAGVLPKFGAEFFAFFLDSERPNVQADFLVRRFVCRFRCADFCENFLLADCGADSDVQIFVQIFAQIFPRFCSTFWVFEDESCQCRHQCSRFVVASKPGSRGSATGNSMTVNSNLLSFRRAQDHETLFLRLMVRRADVSEMSIFGKILDPSTAGNSMTNSERPSLEPLLKKEASPVVLGGREFWKWPGAFKCLEL